ncbi:hypothetical protein [Sodalis sp. dw_96]|uniref:hypothetical protein n=1 Tax=Sodalis sp. dw_96 TaxID=2719794 RepID=UPI001BD1C6B7|nr:hypothetical protein [Sodalis sp. dw_96]
MMKQPQLAGAPPALSQAVHTAPGLDIPGAAHEVAKTAQTHPAAALSRINDIIASRVLGLSLPDNRQIAGWSWPSPPGDAPLPVGAASLPDGNGPLYGNALTASLTGDYLEIRGRQRFRTGPRPDGATILLIGDRDAGKGGYIASFDSRAPILVGEPIFERDGFRITETVLSPARLLTSFQPVDAKRWHPALERAALVEELLHAALDFGILQGFSAAAHLYLTTRTRPWQGQGLAKATDDPHLVRRYGEYVATLHALEGLLTEAGDGLIHTGLDGGDSLARDGRETVSEAGEGSLRDARDAIAAARLYATLAGRSIINGTLELLGAGATSQRYGFDVFWRDFTAHGIAHPPRRPAEVIGRDRVVNRQQGKTHE